MFRWPALLFQHWHLFLDSELVESIFVRITSPLRIDSHPQPLILTLLYSFSKSRRLFIKRSLV